MEGPQRPRSLGASHPVPLTPGSKIFIKIPEGLFPGICLAPPQTQTSQEQNGFRVGDEKQPQVAHVHCTPAP